MDESEKALARFAPWMHFVAYHKKWFWFFAAVLGTPAVLALIVHFDWIESVWLVPIAFVLGLIPVLANPLKVHREVKILTPIFWAMMYFIYWWLMTYL